jgi:type IV pilus assembly protein PilV
VNTFRTHNKAHRGFTMLEVLISIVVIAFGLLGVAGLQAFALKNSQGASFRSIATVLATDLIDRMRSNAEGVDAGAYVNGASQGTATQVAGCLTAAGCGSAQNMAANDLFEWQQLVASSLPGGLATICQDETPNDGSGPTNAQCTGTGPYVIKIWWMDDRNASNTNLSDALRRLTLFTTEFAI